MVIITDANGNIQAPTIPENVYQGSNLANEIVFLAPLPQSNVVTITFRLPDGTVTQEKLMTPYTDVPSQYDLSAWVRKIDKSITALYGQVSFQLKVYSVTNYEDIDNTTSIVSSCQGTFPVLRGVAPLPTANPDPDDETYQEILTYLAYFQNDILDNGWLVSKGILPYDANFTYPSGATIFDEATNTLYTSIQDGNIGHGLDETDWWGATVIQSLSQADIQNMIDTSIASKQDVIDSNNKLSADLVDDTSTINKFVTASDITTWNAKQNALTSTQLDAVNSGINSTKVGQIATNTNDISAINEKIPSQASVSNQLADKNFVNSSIATNTANFIGTFANVSALLAYAGTITNNDYANVINQELDFNDTTEMNAYDKDLLTNYDYAWIPNGSKYDLYRFDISTQTWESRATNIHKTDVSLITAYNRYTYNGSTEEWTWNYTVNTSGFTAVQWEAINSGATATQIAKIGTSALTTTAQDLSGAVNELNSGKEDVSNKVTSLSSASTDTEYPSAKCVYDLVGDIDTILQNINNGGGV